MKNINFKSIFIPTIALLIICLIATTALAMTNSATSNIIANNAIEAEKESRLKVLKTATSFTENNVIDGSDIVYSIGTDDQGNESGYVFTTGAKGYGGEVLVMVGFDMQGAITGIEILSHSETPGLGANAVKDGFKSQFVGKSGELVVDKTSNDGNKVQAITAATITSKAVVTAINAATVEFSKLTGGESNG